MKPQGGLKAAEEEQVMETELAKLAGRKHGPPYEEALSLSSRQARTAQSILERIGGRKLCLIVWRSTPFPLRLISFVYGLAVYRGLLATSKSLCDLRTLHIEKYRSSRSFRLLRPRYHRVRRLLSSLGVEESVPLN